MTLLLRLLGPVEISQGNRPLQISGSKPVALLAYLVMTGQAHSRQHLVDLLIDRAEDPRASLRYTLSELRKAIGADYIQATRQQVGFNFDTDYWLDVTAFEQGQLELYRGDFLEGLHARDAFGFADWAFFERERLRGVYQAGLIQQLTEAQSQGDTKTVIETAHTLLRLDNLQEQWYRALMQSYARLGQREAAIAQYQVCRQILAAEMGLEPSEETTALFERIQTGNLSRGAEEYPFGYRQGGRGAGEQDPLQNPKSKIPKGHNVQNRPNLPPQPTPFIGRSEELARIANRLVDPACRLLTLTGPGGIGKTRLALQAAGDLIEAGVVLAEGIHFVSLASLSSPESLVTTLAGAINLSFHGYAAPRQQLLNHLREKEMLLLLDNFEHLLAPSPDAIDLVTAILAAAPAVKILVTSREVLNVPGEWLYPIDGLPFPTDDDVTDKVTTSLLERYSAVQLFALCARRVKPGFSLAAEQDWVVRICRLVEGMPLGIELAAAWLKIFSCEKIGRELAQGLDLLTTSLKNIPARHRSMRAVFEHSWHLLSETERRVLRQASVFRGGFRREAAEQVAGATFADLVGLVEKSLLHRTPAERYQLHELLRQFAAEKLQAEADEQEAVQHRHSNYYLAFLQQREEALKGKDQSAVLVEIGAEIENVRSGWQWAVTQGNVADIGQALSSFCFLYVTRGWFQDGEQACGRAVASLQVSLDQRPDEETGLILGKALGYQGWFMLLLGLHTRGRALARESLSVLRQLEARGRPKARGEVVIPLNVLGTIARIQGEYGEATQLWQEALTIGKETDNRWELAHIYAMLGIVALELGDYSEARRLIQKELLIGKEIGDRRRVGCALQHMGVAALRSGNYAEARQLLEESVAIHRGLGVRYGEAWACQSLGLVTYHLGEYPEARQLCQDSLTMFRELGNKLGTMESLNGLGNITLALGEAQEAKGHFLEALRLATATQTPAAALDALIGMAKLLIEEGQKERAIELLALPLHHPASWQIFKDRATHLLAELEAELPPEVAAAAQERGKSRKLDEVVAEIIAGG